MTNYKLLTSMRLTHLDKSNLFVLLVLRIKLINSSKFIKENGFCHLKNLNKGKVFKKHKKVKLCQKINN